MKKILESTLGPNWAVKLLGWIAVLFGYIAIEPTSVEFLPDPIEDFLVGSAKLIAAVSGGFMASQVKSSKVTGGSIPATKEAVNRVEEPIKKKKAKPKSEEEYDEYDPIDEEYYDRIPAPLVIKNE